MHCFESLSGSYRNVVVDSLAEKAIDICKRVFLSDDMMSDENRELLMIASFLGGMAAGFGNDRRTRINTRSRQCSLIDRPFQSEYRSPRIPDRRKTPQKSLPGFLSGSQLCIRSMSGQQIDHRISSQISMPMCIDQSGHQKFSPPIDHFYFCSGNNRFGRYFPDRIVLDPYISRDGLFTFPVENHDILNQNSLSHSQ